MSTITKIPVDDKYTILHENGAYLRALRHGEVWRSCVGDGLILAMAHEIETMRKLVVEMYEATGPGSCEQRLVDAHKAIGEYVDGLPKECVEAVFA